MDPLLEQSTPGLREHERALLHEGEGRRPTRLELWAWSEIPAYRLGLTLGYAATIYFGISAFIAGVPAFTLAAPEGWTPLWASALVLGGIVALVGSVADTRVLRAIELGGAVALSTTLVTYAGTILFIAYGSHDDGRVAAGAGFVGLAVPPVIRMFWLIAKTLGERKIRKQRAALTALAPTGG